MQRYFLSLLLLPLVGCTAIEAALDGVLLLRGPELVAVGQSVRLYAGDGCRERDGAWGEGKIPSPTLPNTCSTDTIAEIVDVSIDDPGVFGFVEHDGSMIHFRAVGPGQTRVDVTARMTDGSVRIGGKHLWAEAGDRVVFTPQCVHPTGDVYALPTDTVVRFDDRVEAPHVHYRAGEEAVDAAPLVESGPGQYRTPAEPGSANILSPWDPDFTTVLRFYDVGDVDGVVLVDDDESTVETTVDWTLLVETAVLVDGRTVCVDTLQRVVNWEAPEVCDGGQTEFTEETRSSRTLPVTARASGECRATVRVGSAELHFSRMLRVQ